MPNEFSVSPHSVPTVPRACCMSLMCTASPRSPRAATTSTHRRSFPPPRLVCRVLLTASSIELHPRPTERLTLLPWCTPWSPRHPPRRRNCCAPSPIVFAPRQRLQISSGDRCPAPWKVWIKAIKHNTSRAAEKSVRERHLVRPPSPPTPTALAYMVLTGVGCCCCCSCFCWPSRRLSFLSCFWCNIIFGVGPPRTCGCRVAISARLSWYPTSLVERILGFESRHATTRETQAQGRTTTVVVNIPFRAIYKIYVCVFVWDTAPPHRSYCCSVNIPWSSTMKSGSAKSCL